MQLYDIYVKEERGYCNIRKRRLEGRQLNF